MRAARARERLQRLDRVADLRLDQHRRRRVAVADVRAEHHEQVREAADDRAEVAGRRAGHVSSSVRPSRPRIRRAIGSSVIVKPVPRISVSAARSTPSAAATPRGVTSAAACGTSSTFGRVSAR